MLKVNNLSLKLGKKKILDSLSFEVSETKIVALLGKNGSGKTTLLRALASDLLKHDGDIEVDGKKKRELSDKEYASLIGFLPSILSRPAISVEQLLKFGNYLDEKRENDKQISDILNELELNDLKDNLVCHLSSGQRQLAYFGLLLCKDSKYNLMDEPVSNLDVEVKKQVYKKIKELKQNGKSVLVSLHDINDALDLSDEVIVMDKGKVVFTGTVKEFTDSKLPEDLFHLNKLILKDNNSNEYVIYK